MKNLTLLFIAFLFLQLNTSAQAPGTMWTKTFGGSGIDEGNVIIETKDKGFVVGGGTYDSSFVIRLDQFGDTLWTNKNQYGFGHSSGSGLYELNSGDYVMRFFGRCSGVLRINSNGDSVQYYRPNCPGISCGCRLTHMYKTHHDNFVLSYDCWCSLDPDRCKLVKLDSLGNEIWSKSYENIVIKDVIQKNDSGYAFTGKKKPTNILLIGITNSFGDTLWTRQYLDTVSITGKCLKQTYDNGYIVLGNDNNNLRIFRTNEFGDTLWTKTYGGIGIDIGEYFMQTPDGGYILIGSTESFGAGCSDVWLIKVDSLGSTQWTKTIGGQEDDYGKYVQVTSDGGYIVTGSTNSYGQGESDVWVIKLAPDPLLDIEPNNNIVISDYKLAQNYPNPFNPTTTIKYQISELSFVTLKVYDVLGNEITTLVSDEKSAGYYEVEFDASSLSSGIYFYKIQAASFVGTKKMILLK